MSISISVPAYPAFQGRLTAHDEVRFSSYLKRFELYAVTSVRAQTKCASLFAAASAEDEKKEMKLVLDQLCGVTSGLVEKLSVSFDECAAAVGSEVRGVISSEVEKTVAAALASATPVVEGSSVVGDVPVGVAAAAQPAPPGRWAASNRRKKLARKRASRASGYCATVVSSEDESSERSLGEQGVRRAPDERRTALSGAELEARDTLAQRRAAENKVAKKLAEMKLASLEDEKKCQEYADLKHQRVVQWTNEATAKSQQSLDKVKSIDPSSSASQYEIRQQAKKLADAEAEVRRVSSIVKTLSPDWQELLERKAESTFNTEYIDELMAKGEAGLDNGFRY